ncbi:MAG: glycosyltransferase [Tannerella sp.]|nr:glycosyltransferase [Tannerella sp.]
MKLSIVIPTCNRANLLLKCLNQLSPDVQKLNPNDYEIIVSDDSTDNETKMMIEQAGQNGVIWINGPQKGPASNRNNGARNARGEWIIFIDDDCLPDPDLINNYIRSIEQHPEILVFEGRTTVDRPKRHFLEESPVNENGGSLWSCNFMIHKDYFEKELGGFDENFPFAAMEDVDLGLRIRKQNQTVRFVKEAFVIHPWRLRKDPVEMKRKIILSTIYFYGKHPELYTEMTFVKRTRGEFRFYIKEVLFKLIPYRGKGVFSYIHAHIVTNKNRKKYESEYREIKTGSGR